MIKSAREAKILHLLSRRSPLSVAELCAEFDHVSPVSVRRDIARLAARGALVRTHGGASAKPPDSQNLGEGIEAVDAIVLPPVDGHAVDTLRLMAKRRGIPFLAESSAQTGGIYLGPDNFGAGRDLGTVAGALLSGQLDEARILLVSLEDLPNTRARCDGFLEGFKAAFSGAVREWRVNGQGSFRVSLQASLDVYATVPGINVAFGVNDHSILAALEAADRMGIEAAAFSVGGEGSALFEALGRGGKLRACAALFPEVVGMRAIDVLADALAGAGMPAEVCTPHVILTPQTLSDYYQRTASGYGLTAEAPARLQLPMTLASRRRPVGPKRSIGFVPHYPAHDWYRNMARAMEHRATELGFELKVAAPTAGIAREICALRSQIARVAARRIRPGDTVLINAGVMAMPLAEAIEAARDITVVTNGFDVLSHLSGRPALKVILTSGEYQAKHRCLVGPSLGALFETLRVDKAFLSVDGISARFGASLADERLALAARRFVEASREVFVLADHSLVGVEANHRIVPPRALTELITESGSLPADRLACAEAGLRVILADQDDEPAEASMAFGPSKLPDRAGARN